MLYAKRWAESAGRCKATGYNCISFKTCFRLCDQFQTMCCVCRFLTQIEPCMANYGLLSVIKINAYIDLEPIIPMFFVMFSCNCSITASFTNYGQSKNSTFCPLFMASYLKLTSFAFLLKWMVCQHWKGGSSLQLFQRCDFWNACHRKHFLESRASLKTNFSPCLLSC